MRGTDARVAKDATIYMVGRCLTGLLGFWGIPLLVRILGPEAYGRYSLLVFETVMLPQVTAGWLQQATLRYRLEWAERGQDQGFQATQSRLLLGSALLTFLLMSGLARFVHRASPGMAFALGSTAGFGALQMVWLAAAQAELRPIRVVLAELCRVSVTLGLVFGAVLVGDATLSFAIMALAAGWAASALLLAAKTPLGAWDLWDAQLARRICRFGVPMALWFCLNAGQFYVGRMLLQVAGKTVELGLYSAFQDLAMKIGTVTLMPVVYSVHASGMAQVARGDIAGAVRLVRRAYWVQGGILIVGMAVLLLFPGPITRMLIGPRDAALAMAHPGLGAAVVFTTLMGQVSLLAHKGLEFFGRTDVMVCLAAGSLALGAAVSGALLGTMGAIACALGLLTAQSGYILASEVMGLRLRMRAEGG